MAAKIDNNGDIETLLHPSFGARTPHAGDRIPLVFRSVDESDSPFEITIHSPSGARILERVLRELPTGEPQSAPPVEFVPSVKGDYAVAVREIKGTQTGTATLHIV